MDKSSFHIVLVEPADNSNIGAAARAMMNLGFCNLHLVAPRRFDIERAAITACWARPILETAQIHGNLEDALSTAQSVAGFSARPCAGNARQLDLFEWVRRLEGERELQTALLFGPEDTGLRSEHLDLCRWVVRIPAGDEYRAYNLAQAVLLALFEINRAAWLKPGSAAANHPDAPAWDDFKQLDKLVEEAAQRSRFFNSGTPPHLPGLLKTLFRRLDPDRREMQVLLGLFSRINKSWR